MLPYPKCMDQPLYVYNRLIQQAGNARGTRDLRAGGHGGIGCLCSITRRRTAVVRQAQEAALSRATVEKIIPKNHCSRESRGTGVRPYASLLTGCGGKGRSARSGVAACCFIVGTSPIFENRGPVAPLLKHESCWVSHAHSAEFSRGQTSWCEW